MGTISSSGAGPLTFRAVTQLSGKTATGIPVPPEVVAALGASKRPPVRVTINGYTYLSTVAPMGGTFMLPVSAEVRQRAGVAAGDEVEVDLQLDTAPREVDVPPELANALSQDAAAKRFFEELSYSSKRRVVLGIEEAKTAETRRRRLEAALSRLREGRL